jgi:dihydrofolate reductase
VPINKIGRDSKELGHEKGECASIRLTNGIRPYFGAGTLRKKSPKIKQQEEPDLHVYRSANLLQTLLKHDVVDAIWLKISPITMGSGNRSFADGTISAAFKVTGSIGTSKGVIIVNYERAGAVLKGSL